MGYKNSSLTTKKNNKILNKKVTLLYYSQGENY